MEVVETQGLLLEVLGDIMEDGLPPAVDGSMCPIGDLGLNSMDGVEICSELEDRLGVSIPNDQNPFVDDDGKRGRSISEIAEWLAALACTEQRR